MRNIFLIILTIAALKVAGQNHFVGVKAGINRTNHSSSYFTNHDGYRIGKTTGLTYEYLFKKHFTVGADIIYNQRGFTANTLFLNNSGNLIFYKDVIKYNYEYVSLALKSGVNIGNNFYGFTNIGLIPSLLIKAKYVWPVYDLAGKFIENHIYDETNFVSKFDLAGIIEIGSGYKFNSRFWMYTSFSYQHSFTTITNAEYYSGSIIRFNGMTLTLGLKSALTKE